jgi:hypothetical protein
MKNAKNNKSNLQNYITNMDGDFLEDNEKNDNLVKYDKTKLIKDGKDIIISKYHKSHVMYLIIVEINNDTYCKIGYSEDIVTRLNDLKKNHDSQYLIYLKKIYGQSVEKEFHSIISKTKKYLKVGLQFKNKNKEEYYLLCDEIIDEYFAFLDKKENPQIEKKIIIEVTKQDNVELSYNDKKFIENYEKYIEWCDKYKRKPNNRSVDKDEKKLGTWLKDRKQNFNQSNEERQNLLKHLPYW